MLKSFRRGNHLFAVHVNGIKSKTGTTKLLGLNPLDYVGVSYSEDGGTGTLWQVEAGNWVRYERIGGSANYACNVQPQFRGKWFVLSTWYRIYDWNSDNGYDNFSSWVR